MVSRAGVASKILMGDLICFLAREELCKSPMEQTPRKEEMAHNKRGAVPKIVIGITLLMGLIILFVSVLLNPFLNHHAKPKLERAIAAAHPGSILRIGSLEYNLWRNRVRFKAIEFTGPHTKWTGYVGDCSLSRIQWTGLLSGK